MIHKRLSESTTNHGGCRQYRRLTQHWFPSFPGRDYTVSPKYELEFNRQTAQYIDTP